MRPNYRDWIKDPPDKIVNRLIIVRGIWKAYDIHEGGEEFLGIVLWSSVMSDGISGYKWYLANSFTALDNFNVEITHWAEMFEGPGD